MTSAPQRTSRVPLLHGLLCGIASGIVFMLMFILFIELDLDHRIEVFNRNSVAMAIFLLGGYALLYSLPAISLLWHLLARRGYGTTYLRSVTFFFLAGLGQFTTYLILFSIYEKIVPNVLDLLAFLSIYTLLSLGLSMFMALFFLGIRYRLKPALDADILDDITTNGH